MIPSKLYDAVLCYVSGQFAYFTTQELSKQWGDDWDDAPYEHNAGPPYGPRLGEEWRLVQVGWSGPYETPGDHYGNSHYSVQAINSGSIAWLDAYYYNGPNTPPPIRAGTTLRDFIDIVTKNGGEIYLPLSLLKEEGQ